VKPSDDYAAIQSITSYIRPQKQAAKRHYGSHQYFTKRAWNVVQTYIMQYTKPGDVVCDPYGGSGVTAIEALILNRKAVYLDISEWATFLARQVAAAPVDLVEFSQCFSDLEDACQKRLQQWHRLSESEACAIPIKRWFPKNHQLPLNADAPFVEDLFTHKQLLCLSELYHHIVKVEDPVSRDLLRYAFSATLYMCNRTFLSAKGRKESRGGSSIFSIYRYKIAKQTVELDPWEVFSRRVHSLLKCKRETNTLIGAVMGGSKNARFVSGHAQDLCAHVEPESVDYIFTDPPYGSHIAYLDLTTMWDAWLGFNVSPNDRHAEVIEGGDLKHSRAHYQSTLATSIEQMFKVLKYDRWMSLVFAHDNPAIWDGVVKAAEAAGFEYVNSVVQPVSVVWSMHKKKNPLRVLSGELILNFRKVRSARTLAITTVGIDTVCLIKNTAELSIVTHEGATTDQIFADLIPTLLENGLLGEVDAKIGDIVPLLQQEFLYDRENDSWHNKPGRKLGCHIPLERRIRYYLRDYLLQCERTGKRAGIDDIVTTVLPKLKNGIQPTKQSIITELEKIASPHDRKYWVLWTDPQQELDFDDQGPIARQPTQPVQLSKPEKDYSHNEILTMLADLAGAAGFTRHIGKKEQSSALDGPTYAAMLPQKLPFTRNVSAFSRKKIEQIDLILANAKRPQFAFEIEHSTPITSGLERFIELLKVDNEMARHIVIVAPKARAKKLNAVLSESHYIGAPMYLDRKVRYLWYADVVQLCRQFANQQPTNAALAKAILAALHSPKAA